MWRGAGGGGGGFTPKCFYCRCVKGLPFPIEDLQKGYLSFPPRQSPEPPSIKQKKAGTIENVSCPRMVVDTVLKEHTIQGSLFFFLFFLFFVF